VAAYRFGHSQVRKAYILAQFDNRVDPTISANCAPTPSPCPIKLQVFNNFSAADLHGGRQIATDHLIFWPNFLPVDGQPLTGQFGTGQVAANISRKIDTLLSSGLFGLPIPGAEPAGSAILAKRNLQRAREYGLPSGQAVAARLKCNDDSIHVYTNAEIAFYIPRLAVLTTDDYKVILADGTLADNPRRRCGSTSWRSRRSSTMARSWAQSAAAS
jgi:hypothetical protein